MRAAQPRDAVVLGVAVTVVMNAFAGVMDLLFSDPARVADDPVRGYIWCAAFAVLASAVTLGTLAACGRLVPLTLVVCSLAMWALLPATVFLVGVLIAAGGSALWIPALPAAVWLPVVLWHLTLAVAAVGALGTGFRHVLG
jgi:hypothetical protein